MKYEPKLRRHMTPSVVSIVSPSIFKPLEDEEGKSAIMQTNRHSQSAPNILMEDNKDKLGVTSNDSGNS